MRFFFKSRRFKILLSVFIVLVLISVGFATFGGIASPFESIVGAVTEPFHKLFVSVTNSIDDYNTKLNKSEELLSKIDALEKENNDLKSQLVDAEKIKNENEFYKQFLEIKEKNSEFMFEDATIISRDYSDIYGSFTINKGALDGVSVNDPVITSAGLVGYVTETAPAYSKVVTILNPSLKLGSTDRRTLDIGVINGNSSLALKGYTAMNGLPRSSTVTAGDFIVTSGGGVFPEGLIIGTVVELKQQEKDTSLYAVIKPANDMDEIREVMVLTYFTGQGVTLPTEED